VIDPVVHVALFLAIALAIVALGVFYGEPDDRRALASLPRRYAVFLFGCGVLVAVMLVCERVFVALD
jgi:hypothetical protein